MRGLDSDRNDLSMAKGGTGSRKGGEFWNERALHGSFTGVGNLLAVFPAALSHALMLGMPLTDRGGWRI